MAIKKRKENKLYPIVWMVAGAGIVLIIIALVNNPFAPKPEQESQASYTPTSAAEIAESVPDDTQTKIPTFTPSITPTPSHTPSPTLTPTPSHTPTATATDTPTVTPSVTPTLPPMVTAKQDTRIYSGPDTSYSEQGWLVKDQQALILSQLEGGAWWYIETELGIKGWIRDDQVSTENDLSAVQVVTPYPLGSSSSPPQPAANSPTPAPLIGPLILDEVWPVTASCSGDFVLNVWMRAHGGTGVYTYLVDDQIVAQDIADDGTTTRITSIGNWQGTLSVISGDLRVDREVLFTMADWCQD